MSSSTALSIYFLVLLPSSIAAFYLVLELLNGVFLNHVFILFPNILFHYLLIHLSINITYLKNACRCVTAHVVLELICLVCFFIIFNQSNGNGFGHLIPCNVRCPVDQRSMTNEGGNSTFLIIILRAVALLTPVRSGVF